MANTRPDAKSLIGKPPHDVPMSLQRIAAASVPGERHWIGPAEGKKLSKEELDAYDLAHKIMAHLCIQGPTKHKSGHPGGPLSAFTFTYFIHRRRNPEVDPAMRMSAGHLSLLAYGMQWLIGREGRDPRLASPQAIIESFRKPDGLPGHVEAGIGDIPFGFGPLGKGVSNALGVAFGLQYQKKPGTVDVLIGDGDCQEGQVMEAVRLASHLGTDNLVMHGDFNDIQLSGIPSRTVAADFAAIVAAAGWTVIEVQNGNDPGQVVAALDLADAQRGKGKPVFVCYYTTMGEGVKIMEEGSNTTAVNYHGSPLKDDVAAAALKELPPLDELTKKYEVHRKKLSTFHFPLSTPLPLPFTIKNLKGYARTITSEKGAARQDFGAVHLKALMKSDPRIVVLHGDLAGSGGFDRVAKDFPDRVLNVGVAEANMVMMAAGMRQSGLLPVTYTFAAFGTNEARANARLIDINCGHARCGVLHDCTHAGLSVGEDGETHQERNYLNLPFDHTQVWMLADSNQAAAAAERGVEIIAEGSQSVFAFFPRSGHEQLKTPKGEIIYGKDYVFDGRIDIVRGAGDLTDDVTVIATGIPVHDAVTAADHLLSQPALRQSSGQATRNPKPVRARVLNVACIRPLDASEIIRAALETSHLIVVEDHHNEGGLASQVADVIADFQLPCSLRRLGVNHYFPSGTDKDLKFLAGLDEDSILHAILDELKIEVRGGEDAFVTVIHALQENSKKSRFQKSVQPLIDRLIGEKGYMDALRTMWKKRSIAEEKFPGNDELLGRLKHE